MNICTNLHFVALLPCRSQQFEHQAVNLSGKIKF